MKHGRNLVALAVSAALFFSGGVYSTVLAKGVNQVTVQIGGAAATASPAISAKPTPTVSPAGNTSYPTIRKPTPKPTKKPKSTASPRPTAATKSTVTTKPNATVKPTSTAKPTATPTPSAAPSSSKAVKLGSEYTNAVLDSLNTSRVACGNQALSTAAELNALAEAHALQMAEAADLFHSKYGMVESVGRGTEDGMSPTGAGARAAVHAPQLKDDATVIAYGVGAYKKDGKIYLCVLGGQ